MDALLPVPLRRLLRLGEDVWIAVRLPGNYTGDDDLDNEAAINRWSTVVAHHPPDELGWLRGALAFNAAGGADEGDELDR